MSRIMMQKYRANVQFNDTRTRGFFRTIGQGIYIDIEEQYKIQEANHKCMLIGAWLRGINTHRNLWVALVKLETTVQITSHQIHCRAPS